jgi:aryl-alcohol dehydrogenase-like predicted oxidoreductase
VDRSVTFFDTAEEGPAGSSLRPLRSRSSKRSVALTPSSRSLPSKANQALVEPLGGIAQRKKVMPARIALTWPRSEAVDGSDPRHDVPGLEEDLGALAVDLTPDDLREIDRAASKITAKGDRYPERLGPTTGRRAAARGGLTET